MIKSKKQVVAAKYRLIPYTVLVKRKYKAPYLAVRWKKTTRQSGVTAQDFHVDIVPIADYGGDLSIIYQSWRKYVATLTSRDDVLVPLVGMQEVLFKDYRGIIGLIKNRVAGIATLNINSNDEARISTISASPYDIVNKYEHQIEDALKEGLDEYINDQGYVLAPSEFKKSNDIVRNSNPLEKHGQGLIPKKVPVHLPSGQVIQGIRWVNPDDEQQSSRKAARISEESQSRKWDYTIKNETDNKLDLLKVQQLYSTTHPDFSLSIKSVESVRAQKIQIILDIHSIINNELVGEMVRELFVRDHVLYAHHRHFGLREDQQQKGLGSEMTEHVEHAYEQLGIKAIYLEADAEIGGYAWARLGYDFADKESWETVRDTFVFRVENDFQEYNINSRDIADYVKQLNIFRHSWEFANWNPTNTKPGDHIGKKIMLGTIWNAKKTLDPNKLGYKIGKSYYALRKLVVGAVKSMPGENEPHQFIDMFNKNFDRQLFETALELMQQYPYEDVAWDNPEWLENQLIRRRVPVGAKYVTPGEQPPEGIKVFVGPHGGRYYIPTASGLRDKRQQVENPTVGDEGALGPTGRRLTAKTANLRWVTPKPNQDRSPAGILIPPTWRDVIIAQNAQQRNQVQGRDIKGIIRYKYTALHTNRAAKAKFARNRSMTKSHRKLVNQITDDMSTREEAVALYIMNATGFRAGTGIETKATIKSYGTLTLEKRHVSVKNNTVSFRFIGKSGNSVESSLTDDKLANIMNNMLANKTRTEQIFSVNHNNVRTYLKNIQPATKKFEIKDFRTLFATKKVRSLMSQYPVPTTINDYNNFKQQIGQHLATILGNTVKHALEDYTDPMVWDEWESAVGLGLSKELTSGDFRPRSDETLDEYYDHIEFDEDIEGSWQPGDATSFDPDDDPSISYLNQPDDATMLSKSWGDDIKLSVKAIIQNTDGNILIIKDVYSQFWDLGGGHVADGETIDEALKREVMEETGLIIDKFDELFTRELTLGKETKPVIFFKVSVTNPNDVHLSSEHTAYKWVSFIESKLYNLGVFHNILDTIFGVDITS